MPQPLSTRTSALILLGSTASAFIALNHVGLASAGEPFYGPPNLPGMVIFVAFPCLYILASLIAIAWLLAAVLRSRISAWILVSIPLLALGCWMVTESMLEYSGDQHQQFVENQAHIEQLREQPSRINQQSDSSNDILADPSRYQP